MGIRRQYAQSTTGRETYPPKPTTTSGLNLIKAKKDLKIAEGNLKKEGITKNVYNSYSFWNFILGIGHFLG